MGYVDNITATVCTLNEEDNIAECLETIARNNPREIIVVDGGSEDATVHVAKRFTDKVYVVGRKGLAFQRQYAVDHATGKYVGIFDSDHRLSEGCLEKLAEELEANGYDGIEAQVLSVQNTNYWDWAMDQNVKLTHNIPGPRIMIGTPCLYCTEVLRKVRFDPFFTAASDDTDLCYRLVKAGYKLGVGTPIVYHKHRSSFSQFIRKWQWYGKGDAQFFWKHSERRWSIFSHPIRNYVIGRSIKSLKAGKPQLVLFFVICGLSRHYGFWRQFLSMLVSRVTTGEVEDRSIYKT
ncbi:MAG: glycosyltransferase family 2 protein [Thermodesulfobacteriota bacterium]